VRQYGLAGVIFSNTNNGGNMEYPLWLEVIRSIFLLIIVGILARWAIDIWRANKKEKDIMRLAKREYEDMIKAENLDEAAIERLRAGGTLGCLGPDTLAKINRMGKRDEA
jgi:hypothetical protein